MKAFNKIAQKYSLPLILGIVMALGWVNISPETYERFVNYPLFGDFTVHFFVEDVFMVLFFAIVAVEIVKSLLPGGALNPPRRVWSSLLVTCGGVIGPIVIYLLLNRLIGEPEYVAGWGIATATDITIAWLVAKFIFGHGHVATKYLLLLAVVDDAIGLVIIAVFYPSGVIVPQALLLYLLGVLIALLLRTLEVKQYLWYLVLGGIPCWLGLYYAHVHTALALVLIIPFLPALSQNAAVMHKDDGERAMEKFQRQWRPVMNYGLFFFGLCNLGVVFSSFSDLTIVVLLSLFIGKFGGILLFGYVTCKLGCPLPAGFSLKYLAVIGLVAGIGLTVAIFICNSAFADPALQASAKMGALFSLLVIPIAFGAAKILKIEKRIKDD